MKRSGVDYIAIACAGLCGLAFLSAAVFGRDIVWPHNAETAWIMVAAMAGPGLASWMFFPELGRRAGWPGLIFDLALIVFAASVGIVLAGTLASPLLGTVLAPVYVWVWLGETPALLLILAIGIAAALILSRSRPRG